MKKSVCTALALTLITWLGLCAAPLAAMDVLVGVKAAYVGWHPFLIDVGENLPSAGWEYLEEGSGLMYGPNAAVMLTDRVNLSVSYLYGNLNSSYQKQYYNSDQNVTNNFTGRVEIVRQDLDAALSFSLSPSFKIFIGVKYQPIKITIDESGAEWGAVNNYFVKRVQNMKASYIDPAVGIGLSLPLAENIAFTTNLSLLYVVGKFEVGGHRDQWLDADPLQYSYYKDPTFKMDISGFGANLEPGFVFITSQGILISLGARIQYTRLATDPGKNSGENAKMSGLNDIIYGGFVSVMYKF
jgi:hypothetical protein